MDAHRNIIDDWDFGIPVRQRYDCPSPYTVDRWSAKFKPEIIRRWQEWKRMRDEWAEFLRAGSLPERRIAVNGA